MTNQRFFSHVRSFSCFRMAAIWSWARLVLGDGPDGDQVPSHAKVLPANGVPCPYFRSSPSQIRLPPFFLDGSIRNWKRCEHNHSRRYKYTGIRLSTARSLRIEFAYRIRLCFLCVLFLVHFCPTKCFQAPRRRNAAMAVKDEQRPVHILFFPFLAPGHLIPIADMAALFAARGVKCTILTTPVNAAVMRSTVDRANDGFRGTDAPAIDIFVVPFPDVGLPAGVESGPALNSEGDRDKFFQAAQLLREPFDRFLAENHPDAVVADSFFDWSADAAAEHGVPRLAFLGSSMFARACSDSMLRNNPLDSAPEDPDAIVALPGLPHRVELRRSQMIDPKKRPGHWALFQRLNAADQRSYGELFNSFYELEPEYQEHYTTTLGRRTWLVGPVALASKDVATRGANELSTDADGCLQWLDSKPVGSVAYVSFGTLAHFAPAEMRELARGLDLSGKNFVWVVGGADTVDSEWMPEGFAELLARGDRGLIIRGWAPQMLILNHPAVGGFVTHCGWNSTLEAVSAGVPMVTWPRYADQFYNEKLVTEQLRTGVGVGSTEYASKLEARRVIGGEVVAEAIRRVMGDAEEAEEIRARAKALCEKARRAVEKGGSSYHDVGRLVDELMARRCSCSEDI